MKKVFLLVFCLVLFLGCSNPNSAEDGNLAADIDIYTTRGSLYAYVRNTGNVTIESLEMEIDLIINKSIEWNRNIEDPYIYLPPDSAVYRRYSFYELDVNTELVDITDEILKEYSLNTLEHITFDTDPDAYGIGDPYSP